MNYFIDEPDISDFSDCRKANAGGKAREDIANILEQEGFTRITIPVDGAQRHDTRGLVKLASQIGPRKRWEKALKQLERGDNLVVQFPPRDHSIFLRFLFDDLDRRGVRLTLLIHDLELLRLHSLAGVLGRKRIEMEELSLLSRSHRIIAHNKRMEDALVQFGIRRDRIVRLELFDYLSSGSVIARDVCDGAPKSFVIAGNLSQEKAGYVYGLPTGITFRLYGAGFVDGYERNAIEYCGVFAADEGPNIIQGDFGLVWDGPSVETCEGPYGTYLAVNNPHKTSLYLASGMPIVIWSGAALADFVIRNHVGVAISSLNDLADVANMCDDTYRTMAANVRELSRSIRCGRFTRTAIEKCLEE